MLGSFGKFVATVLGGATLAVVGCGGDPGSGDDGDSAGAGAETNGGNGAAPTGGKSGTSGSGTSGGSGSGNGGAGAGGSTTGGTSQGGTGGAGQGGSAGKATGGTGGKGGSAGQGAAGASGGTPATLKEAAMRSGRVIGVALAQNRLSTASYANAAREFSSATAENEMKWDVTEPTRGQYSYTRGDQIVTFAEQNGMQVRGHTLVWHSQLPSWVSALTSASEVRSAMTNHITQVMSHFRGKVVAWDVVNEAWNDDGMSMRNSVFQQRLGNAFVDEAFQAARAADSTAKLYYNDFGTEGNSAKANAVYTMVQSMKTRGIPIDGVGMQMHTRKGNGAPTVAQFIANMQRLVALGLEVAITEMDVSLCGTETLDARLEEQRTRFHDIVEACIAEPGCKSVTVWGVTDQYSWLNDNLSAAGCSGSDLPRPLLWDDGYQKKPAYSGVVDALIGR
jgi:endo-1,4-beta-xylanase